MCSRMLAATTFAVVSAVGASVMAMQPDSRDVAGKVRSSDVKQIPDDVLSFFDRGSSPQTGQMDLAQAVSLEIVSGVSSPTHQRRYMESVAVPPAPTSAEMPLVPLPSPVYTGAAGLIGLGMVRLWSSFLKSLR